MQETVDQELLNKESNFKSLLLRAVGRRDGKDVKYRTRMVSTADDAVESDRNVKVFVSEAWVSNAPLHLSPASLSVCASVHCVCVRAHMRMCMHVGVCVYWTCM